MHSSRPSRAAAKQQTYKDPSSESELTELDDSDNELASSSPQRAPSRRTARPSVKAQAAAAGATRVRGGRKAPQTSNRKGKRKASDALASEKVDVDSETVQRKNVYQPAKMEKLLTHSTSSLVNVDIHGIINATTWMSLSEGARRRLCQFLPSTAFGGYEETLDEPYPSHAGDLESSDQATEKMDVDVAENSTSLAATTKQLEDLDLAVFTDPHFESAIQSFQDNLSTGYYTHSHRQLVERHLNDIRQGRIHVPWKDEAWEAEHADEEIEDEDETEEAQSSKSQGKRKAVSEQRRKAKGRSDDIRIRDLVRSGSLKVGDIIHVKHHSQADNITVEKECIIHSFTKDHEPTVLTLTGRDPPEGLPPSVLLLGYPPSINAPESESSSASSHRTHPLTSLPGSLTSFSFTSPTALETQLVTFDGRVAISTSKLARPTRNVWKTTTVWRWPANWSATGSDDEVRAEIIAGVWGNKGGRELRGTLHYLRGILPEGH